MATEPSAVGGAALVLRRHPRAEQRITGLIAGGLFVLLAACGPSAVAHNPTAAGLVQAQKAAGDTVQFVLRDGRHIDVDLARAHPLYQGGVTPAVGDLMFVGQDAEQPWFVGISPDAGGEYVLQSRGIVLDAGHVRLDSGLRLPLADGFAGPSGRIEADAPHRIVMDATGEVTSIT